MRAATLLHSALEAVERGDQYGDRAAMFDRHAKLWSEWLKGRGWLPPDGKELDATDVAGMMVLFKVARLAADSSHEDSIVDVAGYAACWSEVADVLAGRP